MSQKAYDYRDRRKPNGISSLIEERTSVKDWPCTISSLHTPFANGDVIAVAVDEQAAQRITKALNLLAMTEEHLCTELG